MLGGGLDPGVAQSNVRATAARESGATLAMAMSAGHGIRRLPCGSDIVADFFDDPSAPLDLSCLEDLARIPFVTNVRPVAGMAHFSIFVGIRSSEAPPTTGGRATPVWLVASTIFLLLAPFIWAVSWIWGRARIQGQSYSAAESRALWLAVVTCGVGVSWTYFFFRATNRTLAVSERLLAVGVLGDPGLVQALPWILTVLAAALSVTAVAAWWRGWWGRWLRVHYGLVACGAASLASFVWFWERL